MTRYFELDVKAQEALEEARLLPHGNLRSEAMKKAGRLRIAAERKRLEMEGTPEQNQNQPWTM